MKFKPFGPEATLTLKLPQHSSHEFRDLHDGVSSRQGLHRSPAALGLVVGPVVGLGLHVDLQAVWPRAGRQLPVQGRQGRAVGAETCPAGQLKEGGGFIPHARCDTAGRTDRTLRSPYVLLWLGPGVRVLRHVQKPGTVAFLLERQAAGGGLVVAELPGGQLLAQGLHLQADRGAVLQAGFPGLGGNGLAEVDHSVRGQGIDGGQDGRVGVLVGVGKPGLLGDTETRGGLRRWPGGMVG